eukprot:15299904-Alexandrium_andersonii.AAC.1
MHGVLDDLATLFALVSGRSMLCEHGRFAGLPALAAWLAAPPARSATGAFLLAEGFGCPLRGA